MARRQTGQGAGQRPRAVGGQVQQHRRGQAPRTFPQQRQHRPRPRRPNHHASDRGDPRPPAAREPVNRQRLGRRPDMPQTEHRAAHSGRPRLVHHPAQRGPKHPAECDLLPRHGANRDTQQHLISELAPVQAGDPLVVEQGPGGRGQRGHPERGHDRRGRRRSEPEPGPQPIPPQAKVGRGQPAGGRGSQGSRGGQAINRRVPPPVPGPNSRQVVIAREHDAGRRGEGHIGWAGTAGHAATLRRGRGRSRRRRPRPERGRATRASSARG